MRTKMEKLLIDSNILKPPLEVRISAVKSVIDTIDRYFCGSITYKQWDTETDDFGRKMSEPLTCSQVRETMPTLIWLRLIRDENGRYIFEAKLELAHENYDPQLAVCVPIAMGLQEVRDLICDPSLSTRIMSLTEEWPLNLVCDHDEAIADFIVVHGECCDDEIPF
ncbi:MAG: hypothetical protein ABJL98_02820 [Lentilitoribacter sp.]